MVKIIGIVEWRRHRDQGGGRRPIVSSSSTPPCQLGLKLSVNIYTCLLYCITLVVDCLALCMLVQIALSLHLHVWFASL